MSISTDPSQPRSSKVVRLSVFVGGLVLIGGVAAYVVSDNLPTEEPPSPVVSKAPEKPSPEKKSEAPKTAKPKDKKERKWSKEDEEKMRARMEMFMAMMGITKEAQEAVEERMEQTRQPLEGDSLEPKWLRIFKK